MWDYPVKEQYTHILRVIEQTGPVELPRHGFEKVLAHTEGNFAFIHDASEVRYQYYKECNFTEVGEPFAEQPVAVAVQQGSHLQVLNSFTSSGVLLLTEIFVSGGNQQSYPGTAEG